MIFPDSVCVCVNRTRMQLVALLFIVCLLKQGSFQGAVEKFALRGEDVLLELQKPLPSEFDNFQWKTSTIIPPVVLVRPNSNPLINPSYSGRVEFSDQDFSLRLKNLQASDSGDFTAGCLLSVFNLSLVISAVYKVTVQEPVSPVDLTVTSVSSSEDSCNLTVTCTPLDSHINTTFRCDYHTCYKEHETSEVTTTNSLEVYWSHGLIICNHSNQVSWTNKSMEVKPPCKSPAVIPPVGLIVGIVIAVAVCGGVCGGVYFYKKRGKWSFQGAVEKFALRGEDVLLELQKPLPSEFDNFQWKTSTITKPVVIVRPNSNPRINPSYSGRVEFSDQDFSLRLKNLQASDSGVYTATCLLDVFDQSLEILAEYKVTVQEPVSPVDLTVTSVSSSEDSCNLTVTCTPLDSHTDTTFRCDYHTCNKEHETSEITTTNSLEVYWSHGLIICNHSNQVSRTNKSMEVKPPCKSPAVIPPQPGLSVGLIVRIVSTVAVCGGVCGGVYFYKKRGKYVEAAGDTVYADVMNYTRGESVNQNQVADSDTSIYSLVMRPLAPVPAGRSSRARRDPQLQTLCTLRSRDKSEEFSNNIPHRVFIV
ncbi:uncharacterized protein LOC142998965 isoform X5 [Genypterus blacodes]|uniref:uncharacterized protein LOC142998965 isoform X5 n=1 Tax=Genypterus blacodes TaxID=154954 RepID=UPI003F773601